jgi:hypothetical protein
MAIAIKGSTYKVKRLESAYDALQDLSFYNMANQLEDYVAKEGLKFKLIGNKWKLRYK